MTAGQCLDRVRLFAVILVAVTTWRSISTANAQSADASGTPTQLSSEKTTRLVGGIVASQETTRITGPVLANGRIDYFAALDAQLREGVTAKNNAAAVLFTHANVDFLLPTALPIRHNFYQQLGFEPPPAERQSFVPFRMFIRELTMGGVIELEDAASRFLTQRNLAMHGPWEKEDQPLAARWLEKNDAALDAIAPGLARPYFYLPMIKLDPNETIASGAILSGIDVAEDVQQSFLARAMRRVDEENIEGASADLIAAHRIARGIARGGCVNESRIAFARERAACRADLALARSGKLSAKQLRSHAAQLAELPQTFDLAEKYDRGDRYLVLDCLQRLASDDVDRKRVLQEISYGSNDSDRQTLERLLEERPIDWNEALRRANGWFDKIAAAGRTATGPQRLAALEAINDHLAAIKEKADEPEGMPDGGMSRDDMPRDGMAEAAKRRGRRVADLLTESLSPIVHRHMRIGDRQGAHSDVALFTFLLEAYRADHGEYPERLAQLTPTYIEKLPQDRFSNTDYVYRRDGKTYEFRPAIMDAALPGEF